MIARATLAALLLAAAPASAGELDELTRLSVGSFTTAAQSARDERYGVAEAEIVRIWPERADGVWLYQEQAFLGDAPASADRAMKDRPYFARVVHTVEVAPGVVERFVHKLKDPAAAQGAWKRPAPLAGLDPDDLESSECRIVATRVAEGFWRSESDRCPNAYKGAAYALSLGVITDGAYANWDRGFDASDAVVWGPVSGGYVFVRKDEGDGE